MKKTRIPENRLKQLREERKLTQQEVAKILDIAHSTVSRHESMSRALSLKDCRAYANLYKVETIELFMNIADLPSEG